MANILLLHGAFRGGWSWGRVAARLAVAGHRVLAPDLPGAGARWRPGHPPVGLGEVLDDLTEVVVAADLHEVVLVGHSQGGFVGEALTQRIADRLACVAHLDAPVPTHGQRAVDLLPPAVAEHLGGAAPPLPPRDAWLPPTPLDADALDVPALVAATWNRALTPLSAALALDPVELDDPASLAVPRHHAFCRHTPPTFPAWATRAPREAAGHDDVVLDSPHDAPLARPDQVADWVRSLC